MLSDIPGFIMFILNAMILLAFVCTSCLVVDTYIRVREWLYFKSTVKGEEVIEETNLGGGIEESEN